MNSLCGGGNGRVCISNSVECSVGLFGGGLKGSK